MGKILTSRERVRIALSHKEADRVPIDFGAMRSTGISAIAYNNLRKKLGIKDGLARMYDFQQQLAYPEKEVRDLFHVDVIDAGQAFLIEDKYWRKWKLNDGSLCLIPKYLDVEIDDKETVYLKNINGVVVGKKPKTSLYVDQVYWPFFELPAIPEEIDASKFADVLWAVPSPPWYLDIFDDKQYKIFIESIKKLHDESEYAIMLAVGCNLFEMGTWLRRFDNFLSDIILDKPGVGRLLDKLVEGYMRNLERVLNGVKDYVDILQFGDDLGTQQGPFVPPKIFKEVFVPRYKEMWNYVHNISSCKIFLHSCGSIYELIPYLIEAGLDVLNPVQTTTTNMEEEKLKREFGKDITFWGGGVNTRDVLPVKSPSEVKEDVKRRIEIFGKGGGYIFNSIHNVMADVPPENVIAMFEAAYEYGKY
jgi:uroporphyrinogen decarboxylase